MNLQTKQDEPDHHRSLFHDMRGVDVDSNQKQKGATHPQRVMNAILADVVNWVSCCLSFRADFNYTSEVRLFLNIDAWVCLLQDVRIIFPSDGVMRASTSAPYSDLRTSSAFRRACSDKMPSVRNNNISLQRGTLDFFQTAFTYAHNRLHQIT